MSKICVVCEERESAYYKGKEMNFTLDSLNENIGEMKTQQWVCKVCLEATGWWL